jgi:type II secretory pathway component GspD/PulD (secretin)
MSDRITLKEFRAWLDGLLSGREMEREALPTRDQWAKILAKLDAKLENPALTLTVIPLKNNDSGRVAPLLEGIFAARVRAMTLPGQQPLPSQQIEVQPDPLNNALIISASKDELMKEDDLPAGYAE